MTIAPQYVNLVLSGGGQRCLAFVGFLRAARKEVSSVRNVYCVSGGAICGLAFCLGLCDDAVVRLVSRHLAGGVRARLGLLLTRFGLDDAQDRLGPMLRDMISESTSDSALGRGEAIPPAWASRDAAGRMTFADLAKETGMNLAVHAVSVETGEVRVFSVDRTPGESVVAAVCASCAVPLFFCPVEIGGELLADGCLAESFPLAGLERAAPAPTDGSCVATDTLVLSAEFSRPAPAPAPGPGGETPARAGNLLEYALRVLGILVARAGAGVCADARLPGGGRLAAGGRARVFRVNAACEVTAARVMCDGLDPASVSRLYGLGLEEGHRFRREEALGRAPDPGGTGAARGAPR